jgi:hypothetical protein
MGRPKKIAKTRSREVRLQMRVETGSIEESLLDYLNDENARPFSKTQMFLTALLPFWQSLVVLHQCHSLEKALQSLENSRYLWELHEQYLRRQIEAQTIEKSLKADTSQQSVLEVELPSRELIQEESFNPFGDENVFLRS